MISRSPDPIRAVIFGATGMVGEGVLHEALRHPDVESVLVVGRKSCEVKDHRLKEILHHDFFDYSTIEQELAGFNTCFFCLGVSSLGMSEEQYSRVTYELTMDAATTLSKLNPGMTFCYVSGTGTDSTESGRSMWARIKGKTENHLMQLPFKAVYLFRPGYIRPTKGLRNAHPFSRAIGWAYPLWRLFAPNYVCTLEEVGKAMIQSVQQGYPTQILENRDIAQLARTSPGGDS
jgi:uncharacterized protein YbjT (DUF2867 family)